MYFFGWGLRSVHLGGAGSRDCHVCQARSPVDAILEYRYFHIFWLFGLILTRCFYFTCLRCSTESKARSHRLNQVAKAGNTRFLSFGPFFVILLGGALLLLGPGDFSD
jgi:hypothetical protein